MVLCIAESSPKVSRNRRAVKGNFSGHVGGLARPKRAKNPDPYLFHMLGHNFIKKGKGVATVVCVWMHGCISKFPSTEGNTHKIMATPLPLGVENATDPRCDMAIWVMFLICSLPSSFTTPEPRSRKGTYTHRKSRIFC